MRALLALALASSVLPSQAIAQKQIVVEEGKDIPFLRPCIDYAAQGTLGMTGQVDDISPPGDLLGHGRYHLLFTEKRLRFGASERQPIPLFLFGHALRAVQAKNALVLVQRSAGGMQLAGWEWIWTDYRGRPFVPVFQWANAERLDLGWAPRALKRFAKPVSYRDPQPFFARAKWTDIWPAEIWPEEGEIREPLLFRMHGSRAIVRYGLYLSDLPAMLKAADAEEDCWR